ncbi:hypothetical protein [Agrobacterium pusense]|uniref:hypothetical protein n=1 Tax=Agrobacterium pusense TaxID=648995 RepID=UPI00384D5B02
MTKFPPRIRKLVDRLFEIADDPATLYGDDRVRTGIIHKLLKVEADRAKKPAPCMYRGCDRLSIARSHTIQRSGPITGLLEGHHVLTPVRTPRGYHLQKIGADDASTFPGFCSKHEGIFSAFETTSTIATDHHVALQTFRTICREIRQQRREERFFTSILEDRIGRLEAIARKEDLQSKYKFESVSVQGGAYTILRDLIVKASRLAQGLEQLYDLHFDAVDRQVQTGLCSIAIKSNVLVPVALSGVVEFFGHDKVFTWVAGVIPQEEGSLLYVAGHPDDQVEIEEYLAKQRSDLDLIDIIESWMVRHTDHWFIRPSVWNSIPADRQDRIMSDMLAKSGVGERYDLSIFDDLRRMALDVPVDIALSPAHRIKLEEQQRKIA